MIQQLMFGAGRQLPYLSTSATFTHSYGTIENAFDGSRNTYVWRSNIAPLHQLSGYMIFTWPTAISVNSSIKIGLAMSSSSSRTTGVNIIDAYGNTHVTSVTNHWPSGGISAYPINHAYPYSTIKEMQFINSYNPATVSQIEIDGTVLTY